MEGIKGTGEEEVFFGKNLTIRVDRTGRIFTGMEGIRGMGEEGCFSGKN
jgi:hypothetical protein